MTEPPKKKLRQSKLLDLFHPTPPQSAKSDSKKSAKGLIIIEDDSQDKCKMACNTKENADIVKKRMAGELPHSSDKMQQEHTKAGEKENPIPGSRSSPLPVDEAVAGSSRGTEMECSPTQVSEGDGDSAPLFTDSESGGDSQNSALDIPPDTITQHVYMGCEKRELLTKPECAAELPQLKSGPNHTVLVDSRSRNSAPSPMKPFPGVYRDRWDADHVRMPCSKENLYPVDGPSGKKELQNRWTLIKSALQGPLTSSYDIEEAILVYNSRYINKWEFSGLHSFLNEVLTKDASRRFFTSTLPGMVKLALDLPEICTQALPLLKRGMNHSLTMSQQQAAALLANAFFCTYPRRNTRQKTSEYSSFPDINFNDLFNGKNKGDTRKKEKLRCLLEYFERVTKNIPSGNLTFTRKSIPESEFPCWASSERSLTTLRAQSSGTIEDDGYGMLQVDFANKFLGGGVLNNGLVQEEIRFMICPEMILSRLLTECLDNNECLVMIGCERFSNYTGYAGSFKWDSPHHDPTPRDTWERRYCEVVAIDAIRFANSERQYCAPNLKREINKAYCGFYEKLPRENLSTVATGNWGCGAFRGDPRLKFLLQMMALAECGRDACYFTFCDPDLCQDIYDMKSMLTDRDVLVSDLWALILQYGRFLETNKNKSKRRTLFRFIMDSLLGHDLETDDDLTPGPEEDSPDYGDKTP